MRPLYRSAHYDANALAPSLSGARPLWRSRAASLGSFKFVLLACPPLCLSANSHVSLAWLHACVCRCFPVHLLRLFPHQALNQSALILGVFLCSAASLLHPSGTRRSAFFCVQLTGLIGALNTCNDCNIHTCIGRLTDASFLVSLLACSVVRYPLSLASPAAFPTSLLQRGSIASTLGVCSATRLSRSAVCAAALVSEALWRYATASSCPVTSPVLGDLWCPDALAPRRLASLTAGSRPLQSCSALRRSAIGWPPLPHSAVPALGDLRLNRHLATPTLAPFGARLRSAVRRLVLRHCGSRPLRSSTALVLSCSGPRPLWSSVAPSMLLCMLL